jgi:hypothetical protein
MSDTVSHNDTAQIIIEVRDAQGDAGNEFGVMRSFLDEVGALLASAMSDYDAEIGDMTGGQMTEHADVFREVSACARRWERRFRSEAKASFY